MRTSATGRATDCRARRTVPVASSATVSVDDLPVGVLAADLTIGELEQVAPAHFDRLTCRFGPTDRPLGHPAITARPVTVLAVLDVRDPVESRLKSPSDLLLADQSVSARRWPTRRVEQAVLSEERHDRVEVMGVECVE